MTRIENIQLIINAHFQDINENIKRSGPEYAGEMVSGIAHDLKSKKLYIGYVAGGKVYGNLVLPPKIKINEEWQEIIVDTESKSHRFALAKIMINKKKHILVIAYDLADVIKLRQKLIPVIIKTITISLVVSSLISFFVVFLVSRNLKKFNYAYKQITSGNLNYRIPVRRANDEFSKLARNQNEMMDWIVTLLDTIKNSSSSLAHDLKTPLSRLKIKLQLLLSDEHINSSTKNKLREIDNDIASINNLFQNILTISKAEDKAGSSFERINLSDLINDVIDLFEPLFEENKIECLRDISENSFIKADKQLLSQAILNLLDNATKYAKGHINVKLKEENGRLILMIKDNGAGIEEQYLDKVKEKFFKVESSRSSGGYGLGLSLVDKVAKLHNAEFILENDNGLLAKLVFNA